MESNYQTEDGHYLLQEDFIFNVKWKVDNLKKQRYSNEDILNFYDDHNWYDYAKSFLDEIDNRK